MSAIQSAPGPVSDLTWDEIYQELKRLAHRNLYASRPGHTLSTTALVNEVYIKLVKSQELNLADRQHLMALSCKAMRQVLVDYARRKAAQKRQTDIVVDAPPRLAQSDLLAVEEALNALAKVDPRLVQLVECRFYGGLSNAETAELMGMSQRTVERDWSRARSYLHALLT
ncbi:MAG: sigma-70 family RNA polymerase sigma factor [Acidobacteria bacterium]|nr:sigma-70 family RNA polymerase sigma factor [Acidobacteriota bacterium]